MTADPVPVPDYSDWTEAELIAHINSLNAAYAARQRENEQTEAETRAAVTTALTDLNALIGDGDPKGTGSIVAVRQYTGAEMAAAAQVALPLAFHGLEILARATRDLARVVGD